PMSVAYPSLGIVGLPIPSLCRRHAPQRRGLPAARRRARRAVPRDRRAHRGLPRDGQASRWRALRFGDVTSDGLVIRKTKFNKSRLVPLHDTAASALGRYLELRRRASLVSDYVFVSPKGGRLPSQTVPAHDALRLRARARQARRRGRRAVPSLRAKRVSPHVLRHTCALNTLQATRDLRKVSLWLGHARTQTTDADPTEKLEALAAMTAPALRPGKFRPPDRLIAALHVSTGYAEF
ncbi:MAG TPA: tyrosine-type recombinase/integrase, partial [Candidatus Dormibacteraeota bacterium]